MLDHSKILITGGTGSFGKTVLQRLVGTDVSEIRILSRDENKQEDMRIELNNGKVKFYIGDVREFRSLESAMHGVDYVFHAAALKQVPSCEFYPMEALRTNILGTENVLDIAAKSGVKKVVMLSTDKAVYPINAMGMSKALAEKIMIAKARFLSSDRTIFCATRYGNVMASRGSVIPLFVSQIKRGKPITITDPAMTRFLMSLDDSVELVLFAFNKGNQGDIFVQKSPSATIADLAQALKEIFNSTSDIQIIGTRHGEKLYESLVSREEMARAEDLSSYYRIPADDRDLNYANYFDIGEKNISYTSDYTSHNTQRLDVSEIKSLLMKLNYIQAEINA